MGLFDRFHCQLIWQMTCILNLYPIIIDGDAYGTTGIMEHPVTKGIRQCLTYCFWSYPPVWHLSATRLSYNHPDTIPLSVAILFFLAYFLRYSMSKGMVLQLFASFSYSILQLFATFLGANLQLFAICSKFLCSFLRISCVIQENRLIGSFDFANPLNYFVHSLSIP